MVAGDHHRVPEAEEGARVGRQSLPAAPAAQVAFEVVPVRARIGESAGDYGDEGDQETAEAAEPGGDA